MTTRIGDLVPRDVLLASVRETLAANLRLWVNVTFPTVGRQATTIDLLSLVPQLADLLARHEVTALVLTEVAEPQPTTQTPGAASDAVAAVLRGRDAGEQRRIVEAAIILAGGSKVTEFKTGQMTFREPELRARATPSPQNLSSLATIATVAVPAMAPLLRAQEEATELENRKLRLSVAARNRLLDGDLDIAEIEYADHHGLIGEPALRIRAERYADTTTIRPRIAWVDAPWNRGTSAPAARVQTSERQPVPLQVQLHELEVLARQLGYTMVQDSEVHDPGEVTLCDEGGSHTYTGTPAECRDWLDGICPGCRKRVPATEADDNGYHPECIARVKGGMELVVPMSPPGPMVPVSSGPLTDGQTVVINPGPQTTKD